MSRLAKILASKRSEIEDMLEDAREASTVRRATIDVVRATVEGLGGQIAVTSTPGAGTRFVLTLPVFRTAPV